VADYPVDGAIGYDGDVRVDKKVGDRADGSVYERVNPDGTVTFVAGGQSLLDRLPDRIKETDWRGLAQKGLGMMGAGISASNQPGGIWGGLMRASDKAITEQFKNRDMQPGQPGGEAQPTQEGQPAEAETPPVVAQGADNTDPGKFQFGDMPRSKFGGGGGGGPVTMDDARMAAGNVGIHPEMRQVQRAVQQHAEGGIDNINSIQQSMQSNMQAAAEARRNVAFQQEQDAREMRDFLRTRMAEEDEMRQELRAASKIQMPPSLGDRPFALVGMAIAGLGGKGGDQFIVDQVNKEIDRDINVQVKQFEQKLGLSRERRAEWDQRMAVLGDVHKAQQSAKIQALEGAKDFFAQNIELAKTEDAKMRLYGVMDKIDMQIAEKVQDLESDTHKEFWKLKEQRRREAAAAAARQAAQEREDAIRKQEMQFKEHMLDKQLNSKEDIANKRFGGMGGAPGLTPKQREDFINKYGKEATESAQAEFAIQRALDVTKGLTDDERVPGFGTWDAIASKGAGLGLDKHLMSEEAFTNRQDVMPAVFTRIKAMSGSAYTDKELVKQAEAAVGSGTAGGIRRGMGLLMQLEQQHREGIDSRYHPSITQEFRSRQSRVRAQKK
jgi:hypothetical protein